MSDRDECHEGNGKCEHMCNNTLGSHYCSCHLGYMLHSDQTSCKGGSHYRDTYSILIIHLVSWIIWDTHSILITHLVRWVIWDTYAILITHLVRWVIWDTYSILITHLVRWVIWDTCSTHSTLGCPRLLLIHMTKLPTCPIELHKDACMQIWPYNKTVLVRLVTLKMFVVDFDIMELNWTNGQLCQVI